MEKGIVGRMGSAPASSTESAVRVSDGTNSADNSFLLVLLHLVIRRVTEKSQVHP